MAVTERTADELAARGAAAVVIAVVIWGIGPILIKKTELPSLVLAFWRLWFGFAVIAGTSMARGGRIRWSALRQSAMGGLFFGVNVALFTAAVQRTSVAEVTLVSSFQPVLVVLLAGPLFGERAGRREISLIVVALLGVVVFEAGAMGGPVWSLSGYLFAVGALFTFTGYYLASKRAREHLDALEYMAAALLVSAAVITPIALVSGQPLGAVPGRAWVWVALFVLFPGALGHFLINWAHRFVDVTISSVIVVGLPVVAALLAWLLLGETLGPLELLGGAVVIACVAAIATRPTLAPAADELPI